MQPQKSTTKGAKKLEVFLIGDSFFMLFVSKNVEKFILTKQKNATKIALIKTFYKFKNFKLKKLIIKF